MGRYRLHLLTTSTCLLVNVYFRTATGEALADADCRWILLAAFLME